MNPFEDFDDPVLAGAQQVLRGYEGQDALDALGWSELLPLIEVDRDARRAVFALFRAQGRELSSSDALGRIMALPYLGVISDLGSAVASVERRSPRRGVRALVVGPAPSGRILVDRPGRGLSLIDAQTVTLRTVGAPGGLGLHEIVNDLDDVPILLAEPEALALRERRHQLGRIAIAHEILGAAEADLSVAVKYAVDREQFGRPIGTFQAVRHLLAAARVECAAIEALAAQAVDAYPALPAFHDAILKALAGRNGRRACEGTLQVLGAIGFTLEHSHNRFHSRVLALDTLLGTSSFLSHELAVTLRTSQGCIPDLRLPAACEAVGL